MKHLKSLGLAAVVAAGLAVLAGVGTASATILCSVEGEGKGTTCPGGKAYGLNQEIHAVIEPKTNFVLSTMYKIIECEESTIKVKVEEAGGEKKRVFGPVESLTFGKCNCSITVLKNGTFETNWIEGSNNGDLFSNEMELTTVCTTIFGNVHCIYRTSHAPFGLLKGGNPAKMETVMENEEGEGKAFIKVMTNVQCKEYARWFANYEITTPKPLYITGE